MKILIALLALGILLFGCAQQPETAAPGTGGATGGSGGAGGSTGGSGGQVVDVGETTGGTGGGSTGSGETGGGETGTGGSGGGIIGVETPASEGDVTVYIRDFQFVPETVTVKQGSTVFWVNEDNVPHAVRMIGVIDSPYLAKDGAPFWHTFTERPGTYEYSCSIHLSMHGTVIVTE
ncbi:MAG: plastocyanin/azurin family copper-binding protein [Candidatus Micrarchaeia archaeon]